jgi:hypothetical protein
VAGDVVDVLRRRRLLAGLLLAARDDGGSAGTLAHEPVPATLVARDRTGDHLRRRPNGDEGQAFVSSTAATFGRPPQAVRR